MIIGWTQTAWDEYIEHQSLNRKAVKRIHELISSIRREGFSRGIGKPEPLKYRKAWSRRIDDTHRLVYNIDSEGNLIIYSCKGHYKD